MISIDIMAAKLNHYMTNSSCLRLDWWFSAAYDICTLPVNIGPAQNGEPLQAAAYNVTVKDSVLFKEKNIH